MRILMIFLSVCIATLAFGSVNDKPDTEKAIKIGDQLWMTENLNVSVFRNGDKIPEVKSISELMAADEEGLPAWCYYDNDPDNGKKYGKLYNWYAVKDKRGLAPEGWQIPSKEDWLFLVKNLAKNDTSWEKMDLGKDEGHGDVIMLSGQLGYQLKSTNGWLETDDKKGNGSNSSGFNALPAGFRLNDAIFEEINKVGVWWSLSESSDDMNDDVYFFAISNDSDAFFLSEIGKGFYLSVRCVKNVPKE